MRKTIIMHSMIVVLDKVMNMLMKRCRWQGSCQWLTWLGKPMSILLTCILTFGYSTTPQRWSMLVVMIFKLKLFHNDHLKKNSPCIFFPPPPLEKVIIILGNLILIFMILWNLIYIIIILGNSYTKEKSKRMLKVQHLTNSPNCVAMKTSSLARVTPLASFTWDV